MGLGEVVAGTADGLNLCEEGRRQRSRSLWRASKKGRTSETSLTFRPQPQVSGPFDYEVVALPTAITWHLRIRFPTDRVTSDVIVTFDASGTICHAR